MTNEEQEHYNQVVGGAKKALKDYLEYRGQQYPIDEWVTVKEYAKRFNIPNQQTVSNWIIRGIIPPENIVVIEELNNIRLIKAVKYQG